MSEQLEEVECTEPQMMSEEDLTIILLYSVAESMAVQIAKREKKGKKFQNAMKVKELITMYARPSLYPGYLPVGYAEVLIPYFDELGKDINRFLVKYENFSIDKPTT